MVDRPAPRIVERGAGSVLIGSVGEWVRLLVGAGTNARSSRAHVRLGVGWIVVLVVAVTAGRDLRSAPDVAAFAPSAPTSSPATTTAVTAGPSATGIDLAPLSRSTLFRAPVTRPKPQPNAVVPDLANELQLQGVIGGDEPQAIVLHKRTQQIHTVRVGQRLGEFEVIEIHSMRVVLKWRDETIELSI